MQGIQTLNNFQLAVWKVKYYTNRVIGYICLTKMAYIRRKHHQSNLESECNSIDESTSNPQVFNLKRISKHLRNNMG